MNKITKALVGSALAGFMLVGSTSCTTGEALDTKPSASEQATEATVVNGLAVKPGVVNDGKGDYRQTTVAEDDPLMTSLGATPDATVPSTYTEEDALSAQQFVVKFVTEEVLDSTANGTGEAGFDAWWEKNKGLFAADQHQAFLDYAKANPAESTIVINGAWREAEGREFMYGEDSTRIQNRILSVTKIFGGTTTDNSGREYIAVQLNFTTKSPMKVEGQSEPFEEEVSGDLLYSVIKGDDGKWVIVGSSTDVKHN